MDHSLATRQVGFYDDELLAVQQPDGTVFCHFGRVCDNLGLNRSSAVRRVQAHAILGEGLVMLPLTTEGGTQAVHCLRLAASLPGGVCSARLSRRLDTSACRIRATRHFGDRRHASPPRPAA